MRVAALLLALSGCATATCPAQLISSPARALEALSSARAPIRSLRAEAKIDQRGKEGRVKGRAMMFVEKPDRVRFDVMTQFGPALILTSDGETFALSDFKDNRFLTGPSCAQNLGRVIGVALSSGEVASVLLGEAPAIGEAQALRCGNDGRYLLERRAEDGSREELELSVHEADRDAPADQQRLYLSSATLWNAQGQKLYRVRYEDYQKVGGSELPHTVRIDDFAHDSDALVRLSDVALDVTVPDGAFVQAPRAGLKVEEVSCDRLQ